VVLLVRHAESEANAAGGALDQAEASQLTSAGRAQALALQGAFRETRIDAVFSSDLVRAVDTVAPLAGTLGLGMKKTPLLREPRSGRRTTKFADAEQVAALLTDLSRAAEPSMTTETHAEVVTRLRRFLTELGSASSGGAIVVCSHFVTLNVLLRLLVDERDPPAAVWAHFDNASVTRVDFPAGSGGVVGIIRYMNWAPAPRA
jgi:broad specificity phosphatase PhoE